ncbi:MAG TPA: DUF1684 domain-containing protein [Terracidiphilus sp.]|nr:DUF1684 domain-containing protein [Terracidiphilus sp.]
MMRGFARLSAFALTLAIACGIMSLTARTAQAQSATSQPAAPTESTQWQQELGEWRSQRAKEIAAPDSWLTLAGLEWLKPGINSVGSAADNQIRLHGQAPEHLGLLTIIGQTSSGKPTNTKPTSAVTIQLLAPSGGFPPELTIDGKPAREGSLVVDNVNPSTIAWHDLSLVVLKRGDRYVLRIKDANSPARSSFHGLNWYAPDSQYLVTARWVPFNPPLVEEIPTVIGTTLKLPAPGLAMFLLDGKILHLEPVLEDPSAKTLFFILRDETSTTTTYGGGRFLHTGLPDHGLDQPGSLTLDFNRLENPPCAYTVYATCPLPPAQNRLAVALQAGERRYEQ